MTMENSSSNADPASTVTKAVKAEIKEKPEQMGRGDIPSLVVLLVEKLCRSLGLTFEVAMLSILVTFSTYMRAKTIDGYYFTQKATLWGLVLHGTTDSKVSTVTYTFLCNITLN